MMEKRQMADNGPSSDSCYYRYYIRIE